MKNDEFYSRKRVLVQQAPSERCYLLQWLILSLIVLAVFFFSRIAPANGQVPGAGDGTLPKIQALNLRFYKIDASAFPRIVSYVNVNNDVGFAVGALDENNFRVFEDSRRQLPIVVEEITTDSIGVNVALVIDRSSSMRHDGAMDGAKAAAKTYVNLMNGLDEAAVVSFGNSPRTDHEFSTDKTSLNAAIDGINYGGGTELYDAIIHTANLLGNKDGNRAMILMTDGDEKEDSESSYQQAKAAFLQLGIPAFCIGLNNQNTTIEANMIDLANASGGKYYYSPDTTQLAEIYKTISTLLHHQYRVTYTTDNPRRDGSLRAVRMEVDVAAETAVDTSSYRAPIDRVAFVPVSADVIAPGREFTVSVEIPASSIPVYRLRQLHFQMRYNTQYLDLVQPANQAVSLGQLFDPAAENQMTLSVDENAGTVGVTIVRNSSAPLVEGRGMVAHLRFRAVDPVPDNLSLQFRTVSVQAFDDENREMPSEGGTLLMRTYGYVTMAVTTQDTCSPGQDFAIDIVIPQDGKAVPELRDFNAILKYDTRYLSIKQPQSAGIQAGALFGGVQEYALSASINQPAGEADFGVAKKNGFAYVQGRGQLVRMVFEVSPDIPDSTVLTFALVQASARDGSDWDIPLQTRDLTLASYGLMVWPGDINRNGTVELTDVNALGVYWGLRGPGRPGEADPLQWKAQFSGRYPAPGAADADADGSGRIDEQDVIPVARNWNLTRGSAAAKQANRAAEPASGSVRLQVEPAGEGLWRVKVRLDSEQPQSVTGVTFRMKKASSGYEFKGVKLGDAWPQTPIYIVNEERETGVLAGGFVLTPEAGGMVRSGSLIDIILAGERAPQAGDFVFENMTLVGQNGAARTVLSELDVDSNTPVPFDFTVSQAYPNPFNPSTRIDYVLRQAGDIEVSVYSVTGQRVLREQLGRQDAGRYSWQWRGQDGRSNPVSSGVYYIRLRAVVEGQAALVQQRKVVLLK